ncbi:uncharacterized protein [Rutidosis leptorrhynchoides]|uniref:uncharacterized protein isoform X4 n=1 Tax=Rutidosis leptorrhynchoides TaxID=125765 RepID=UPI003A99724F
MDLDNIECVSSSDGLDDEEEFYNSDLQRCETSNDKRRLKAQLNVICELSLNLQFRVKNRVHECSKDLQFDSKLNFYLKSDMTKSGL